MNLSLSLPGGVKKSISHPHPVPPPSRGREILFEFQNISPLLLAGEGREKGRLNRDSE
jgi:hypothetical protein